MAFEINTRDSKAASERGIIVPWEDPETKEPVVDEDGNPVTCTLVGGDADKVVAKTDKNLNKFFDRLYKGQGRKNDKRAQESREELIDRVAAATVAWSSNWTYDGAVLECNEQNARRLYSDPRFRWLLEQMQLVVDDRARFFTKSSTS